MAVSCASNSMVYSETLGQFSLNIRHFLYCVAQWNSWPRKGSKEEVLLIKETIKVTWYNVWGSHSTDQVPGRQCQDRGSHFTGRTMEAPQPRPGSSHQPHTGRDGPIPRGVHHRPCAASQSAANPTGRKWSHSQFHGNEDSSPTADTASGTSYYHHTYTSAPTPPSSQVPASTRSRQWQSTAATNHTAFQHGHPATAAAVAAATTTWSHRADYRWWSATTSGERASKPTGTPNTGTQPLHQRDSGPGSTAGPTGGEPLQRGSPAGHPRPRDPGGPCRSPARDPGSDCRPNRSQKQRNSDHQCSTSFNHGERSLPFARWVIFPFNLSFCSFVFFPSPLGKQQICYLILDQSPSVSNGS